MSVVSRSPGRALASAEHLVEILGAETALFAELAELAAEQREALAEMDAALLERLAGRVETQATRFELLEKERERLEALNPAPQGDAIEQARAMAVEALRGLLREGAVSATVLNRLADTVAARRAAVASLFGASYLADGREAGWRVQGASLSAEG